MAEPKEGGEAGHVGDPRRAKETKTQGRTTVEPMDRQAEVNSSARRPEVEPGDLHSRAELEDLEPKTDLSC